MPTVDERSQSLRVMAPQPAEPCESPVERIPDLDYEVALRQLGDTWLVSHRDERLQLDLGRRGRLSAFEAPEPVNERIGSRCCRVSLRVCAPSGAGEHLWQCLAKNGPARGNGERLTRVTMPNGRLTAGHGSSVVASAGLCASGKAIQGRAVSPRPSAITAPPTDTPGNVKAGRDVRPLCTKAASITARMLLPGPLTWRAAARCRSRT